MTKNYENRTKRDKSSDLRFFATHDLTRKIAIFAAACKSEHKWSRQSDAVYDDDHSGSSRRRSLALGLAPLIFRPNRGPEVGRKSLSRAPSPPLFQGGPDERSP